MMKKKKLWKVTAATTAMLMMAALTGCGASSSSSVGRQNAADGAYMSEAKSSYAEAAYATEDLYEAEYEMDEVLEEALGTEPSPAEVQDTSRKLITTVELSAETEDFDAFNATIEKKTAALGGYLESVQIYNTKSYYETNEPRARNADYTIRIPAKKLDQFLNAVQEQSNILNKSLSVEDVTLSYVDIQSHKKALTAERDRLLELVTQAETVEDIIALEDRIAMVRYEIESIESRLRTYDNQVDYSTIYLNVEEVVHYTPVDPQTTWQRMREGFAESLEDVVGAFRDLAVWFVINLPRILAALLIIVVLLLVIRTLIHVLDNPSEKRIMKQEISRAAAIQKSAEKARKRQEAQQKAQAAIQAQAAAQGQQAQAVQAPPKE